MKRRRLSFAVTFAVTSTFAIPVSAQHIRMVPSDARCPSEEMIRSALPPAAADGERSAQTVTVEVTDDRLVLSLGEAPGAQRQIPADADCSVRAEGVAVVIAAWSGQLGARPTDSPVLTTTKPSPAPAPAPVPVPALAEKAAPGFDLDGGGFYSMRWGHAPGGSLALARMSRTGGLGARVLGAYQSGRDVPLEGAATEVLRFVVGATAVYQIQSPHFFASGDVGLVGTFTRAKGVGYETNRSASTMNFGGLVDVRGGLRMGRFRLWSNASFVELVHSETVKIQSTSPGVADSAALAAWDFQVGGGLGFHFQ